MDWRAEIVSEPGRGHELCVDVFEGDVHRARIQRSPCGVVEFVSYADQFSVPAGWLIGVIQRFNAETGPTGAR